MGATNMEVRLTEIQSSLTQFAKAYADELCELYSTRQTDSNGYCTAKECVEFRAAVKESLQKAGMDVTVSDVHMLGPFATIVSITHGTSRYRATVDKDGWTVSVLNDIGRPGLTLKAAGK